ncbi:Nitrilase family, member 2 [Seminavis robusta]|uniref:Nitrilase family, member 2 n=1 Tax=Seminavis robusta TaxID=568900 RepID=A0A9N8F0Q1_9STRA|nr:Nitrilase family, member 2 [Seminavis robusta]|eukprot:Sro2395_g325950.1 Nitrilase family, member 2 (566) ;mRNA; r:5054-7191
MSAVGPPRRQYFADDFVPSKNFVICGRGKKSYGHVGNQYFLHVVAGRINDYARADTKQAKSEIVQKIVREIDEKGGFIRQDEATGQFYRAEDGAGREKTSQALRDCLKHKYKSSKDIKKTNRKAKRMARRLSNKERRGSMGSTGTAHSHTSSHGPTGTQPQPANTGSTAGISSTGIPTNIMPQQILMQGFDPGALGKSRRHRRNSMGNVMPVTTTSSWDTTSTLPATNMEAVLAMQQQQQQQQANSLTTANPYAAPSPMTTQSAPINEPDLTDMVYAKPNPKQTNVNLLNNSNAAMANAVNPWGSRSARGVVRRASASSYFQEPNPEQEPNMDINMGFGGMQGIDMLSAKGTIVQNAALGYNDDDVVCATAGLPGDFQARRRTSTSSYGSNASSYWSGADSASTSSGYNHFGGTWVDGNDEDWAAGLNLNLLGELTDDLDALRMAAAFENDGSGRSSIGSTGGGVPVNIGGAMPVLAFPDATNHKQQAYSNENNNGQQVALTAKNLATMAGGYNPQQNQNQIHVSQNSPGLHRERRVSASTASAASNYWAEEVDDTSGRSFTAGV